MPPTEPFSKRLRRLARERKVSLASIGYRAYHPGVKGTSPATFNKVLQGTRSVNAALIEAVAEVLEVKPEEFPEYQLALARQQLDENEVGLERALANLRVAQAAFGDPSDLSPATGMLADGLFTTPTDERDAALGEQAKGQSQGGNRRKHPTPRAVPGAPA